MKQGRDNSATLNWNLKTCGGCCSHDSDGYQHDRWLYITHVGEWRLSANQTVHFNFHLGRAILRGQRAIWLACKKYYPLSTSYHSSAGEQRPVRNPGSSYQANHWLCNDRCPGKGQGHGDTLQPQNLWTGTDWTALPMRKSTRQRKKCFRVPDGVIVLFMVWAKPVHVNQQREASGATPTRTPLLSTLSLPYSKLQTPAEGVMENVERQRQHVMPQACECWVN